MEIKNGKDNKGSASVFMLCLLIPMIIFICTIITIAQLMAADGYAADAESLAENSVYASYNKAFFDSYGIMCYSKGTNTLTNIANTSAYESNHASEIYGGVSYIKADTDVKVFYKASSCINNDSVLLKEINSYMSDYIEIAGSVTYDSLNALNNRLFTCNSIKTNMQNHLTDLNSQQANSQPEATESSDSTTEAEEPTEEEITASQDASDFRTSKIGTTDIRNITVQDGNSCFSANGSSISTSVGVISSNYDSVTNVSNGIAILDAANEFYAPLSEAYEHKGWTDSTYRLAIYCYQNFSAYDNYCGAGLTGREYGSGNYPSVSEYGEGEYILNGAANEEENWNKVKELIYETYFTEYLSDSYYSLIGDAEVINQANVLSGGDSVKAAVIMDEIAVGICAKLAYKATDRAYVDSEAGINTDRIFNTYMDYMELFMIIETTRNKTQVMSRMKKVMQLNMSNSSYGDAHEFNIRKSYLTPIFNSNYSINTSF